MEVNDKRKKPHVIFMKDEKVKRSRLGILNASEVKIEAQPWLWEPYFPLQTSTLIAGTGGIGKSQLLLYIAGLISNGSSFKINSIEYKVPKGRVVILSAEDSIESNIVPRLKAVNANLNNIEIVTSVLEGEEDVNERFLALDYDIKLLEEKIKEWDDVKLIIIDPITAYLGNVKENQSVEVRNFILKLNKLAKRFKLSILLNTHTRKKGTGESSTSAADEIMGSTAWYNTVRQAFTISRDHEDKERILFINCKSNCGAKPEAFDYKIEPIEIIENGEIIKISSVNLLSGKVDVTADEALNKDTYEKRLITDEAKEFIKKELKTGSKSAEHMRHTALSLGINEYTLKKARQQLMREGVNIIMEPSQIDGRKMIWYIGV